MIIPFHLGRKVYVAAQGNGHNPNVSFYDCGDTTHKKNYLSRVFDSTLDSIVHDMSYKAWKSLQTL